MIKLRTLLLGICTLNMVSLLMAAKPEASESETPKDIEKRGGPKSFYAWNGKRSDHHGDMHAVDQLDETGLAADKRKGKSFYAWNGKRGGGPKSFYAWNGKRSYAEEEQEDADEGVRGIGKRRNGPKSFYAWNGKRGGPKSFYAWNGKRGGPKSFYAWNGKRNGDMEGIDHQYETPLMVEDLPSIAGSHHDKRGGSPKSFYAWNGKRGGGPKSFYAWNGKRSDTETSANVADSEIEPISADDEDIVHIVRQKRSAPKSFYAWNGKRSGGRYFNMPSHSGMRNRYGGGSGSFMSQPHDFMSELYGDQDIGDISDTDLVKRKFYHFDQNNPFDI